MKPHGFSGVHLLQDNGFSKFGISIPMPLDKDVSSRKTLESSLFGTNCLYPRMCIEHARKFGETKYPLPFLAVFN